MYVSPHGPESRSTDSADAPASGLTRLDELADYQVAEGYPDPRGWDVRASSGQKVGQVESLIVDLGAMRARYLEVKLDRKALELDSDRRVLIPVGIVRLDDDQDDVLLGDLAPALLAGLPSFTGEPIERDYETDLRRRLDQRFTGTGADGDYYTHEHFDQDRFLGARAPADADAQLLTLAEERLVVDERQVPAGQVELRTKVDTEHVRQQVPVTQQEVTLERRPVTNADTAGDLDIREQSMTVPLVAEELVVSKRVVPSEQVVVRKERTTEQKSVEAELRRQRLEVERTGDVRMRDATADADERGDG